MKRVPLLAVLTAVALLAGCGRLSLASLCALLAAGAQVGTFEEGARSDRVSAPYVAAGGRLALEVPWGDLPGSPRLAVQVYADLLAALSRWDLRVGDMTVGRTPALAGAFGRVFTIASSSSYSAFASCGRRPVRAW